ncbi:MAG: DUF2586 family protein [Spirochaetota bacterium]
MPTGNVTTTHQSGGLTESDVIPDRVHAKVGQAEEGIVNKAYYIRTLKQAKNVFGRGPLIDSLTQYFEEFDESLAQKPVPVICVRPDNDGTPTASTANLDNSLVPVRDDITAPGTANGHVNGTPTGDRVVKLKIVKGGAAETAVYRLSTDGGVSYGEPIETPASGSPISLDAGMTLDFTNDTGTDAFVEGDIWTVNIYGPSPTRASIETAVSSLIQEYRCYWIHVLGGVTRAFAVSINSILTDMQDNYNQPTFAILEGLSRAEAEVENGAAFADDAGYFQYIQDEYDPFQSERIAIVIGEGRYISGGIANAGGYAVVDASETIAEDWRNAATLLTAKLASGGPNVSAGYVREKRSLTFSEIRYWDQGYQDYMDTFHDMRLTVLKEYNDYDGIFIARDRIKSGVDSDFIEIPERRRADKMHRIVYQSSLPFLNQDTEIRAGAGGIEYLKASIDAQIAEEMEKPGRAEISSHKIVLDPDGDFALTGILKVSLAMYVAQRIKAIEWETTFARTS